MSNSFKVIFFAIYSSFLELLICMNKRKLIFTFLHIFFFWLNKRFTELPKKGALVIQVSSEYSK